MSILSRRAAIPLRMAVLSLFWILILAPHCYATSVVFIRSSGTPKQVQQQLEIAANFYGLNLQVSTVNSVADTSSLLKLVQAEDTVAVAIAADALPIVDRHSLRRALHRKQGENTNLLVLEVDQSTDPKALQNWSDGASTGCSRLDSPKGLSYVFGSRDGLTRELTDLEVPSTAKNGFYLVTGPSHTVQPIISLKNGSELSPFFVETSVDQVRVFVACASGDEQLVGAGDVVSVFLRIAPAMMFVRYSAGELGWHAPGHYANFTIDDPWLRQPYGYVDYQGLLQEMEKHNFHTTIAFIPWNYDRSEPSVVSIFKSHPERFSIAIHGDNHDHKEFTDYRSKPLAAQVDGMEQSLARMEKFQALTGIPYDKVMIFPHSIAPEKTLEALKTYNYLATVNSTNVPQGSIDPPDPLFSLRPLTLSFGDFPSVSRYSVAAPIPEAFIAVNQFLDNPLLFYGHSDSFAAGVASFDGVADDVNKLEPNTEWRGLGEIARHLYLMKQSGESSHDVLAFSSSLCFENPSKQNSVFDVQKQETGDQVIDSVLVEGRQQEYRLQDGVLHFAVTVPPAGTSCVAIRYKNDLALASIDISNHSPIVYFLRTASDFRDIYLSKSAIGLAIVHFYENHQVKPAEAVACVAVLLVILLYAVYRLQALLRKRRRSSKSRECPQAS